MHMQEEQPVVAGHGGNLTHTAGEAKAGVGIDDRPGEVGCSSGAGRPLSGHEGTSPSYHAGLAIGRVASAAAPQTDRQASFQRTKLTRRV